MLWVKAKIARKKGIGDTDMDSCTSNKQAKGKPQEGDGNLGKKKGNVEPPRFNFFFLLIKENVVKKTVYGRYDELYFISKISVNLRLY